MIYETASPLIRSLCEFTTARLPTILKPEATVRGTPCLAENWWVEDRLTEGRHFPLAKLSQEDGLRFCWRWAHQHNVHRLFETGEFMLSEPADLLLHQMTVLLPITFSVAESQYEDGEAA